MTTQALRRRHMEELRMQAPAGEPAKLIRGEGIVLRTSCSHWSSETAVSDSCPKKQSNAFVCHGVQSMFSLHPSCMCVCLHTQHRISSFHDWVGGCLKLYFVILLPILKNQGEKEEVSVVVANIYWSLTWDILNIKYHFLTVALHMIMLLQNQFTA